MNPLAYPVSRIVGLEPRSATPAANTIPVAGSGGTIADGWLSGNVPRLNAANTFTGPVTVQSASTTVPALTVEHSANATQRLRNTAAGGADVAIFCTNDTYSIGGSKVAWGITGQPSSNAFLTWALAANRLGVGNGNVNPTATLDVLGDTFRLRTSRTPASSTATGNQGDSCYDGTYLYWCSATNTWQRIIRPSIATPAQFTANQNNWAPTIAKVWRVSTDASRDLTGINIGQWGGDEHSIINTGSNNLVLKHQDTNSTAAYRFISVTGADITLAAGEMALLWYDSTSLRWRIAKV